MGVKEALSLLKTDIYAGSSMLMEYYLGRPFLKIKRDPVSPNQFFGNTPAALQGATKIYLVGYSATTVNESGLPPEDARATQTDKMFLFSVELGYQTPSRASLVEATREFNRWSHSWPVLVLYRHGAHLSIGVCERNAYKLEWRQGMRVARTSLLHDIPLSNTVDSRLQRLEKAVGAFTSGTAVSEQYQRLIDLLCSQDNDLTRDIILGQWKDSKTVLPLSRVLPFLGRQMNEIIKNGAKSYYCFLKGIEGPEDYSKAVDQYVLKEIEPHVRNFKVRFNEEPDATTVHCFCCSSGLFLVTKEEAEIILSEVLLSLKTAGDDPAQKYLQTLINWVEDSLREGKKNAFMEAVPDKGEGCSEEADEMSELRTIDLSAMTFTEELLNQGEYDGFPLNRYTVSNPKDWRRVEKLKTSNPTIRDIRCPSNQFFLSLSASQENDCEKFSFKDVVCRELLSRKVEEEQGVGGDDILLKPSNTPEELEGILGYLKENGVLPADPTIGDIRNTTFLKLVDIKGFRPEVRYPQFIQLKLALSQIVEAESFIERMDHRFGDRWRRIGIRWNTFTNKERVRAERMMEQTGKLFFPLSDLFEELKDAGKEDRRHFARMRRKFCQRLLAAQNDDLDDICFYNPEFYSLEPMPVTLSEIDELLYDFIPAFLQKHCELRERVMAIARLGILRCPAGPEADDRWTLESIGDLLGGGLTRQRIKQLLDDVEDRLKLTMPLNEKTIQLALESKPLRVAAKFMPRMFNVFRKDFSIFKEFMCLASGSGDIMPEVDESILDDYFCNYGQPVYEPDVIQWLQERRLTSESVVDPEDIVGELQERGVIAFTEGNIIRPRKLHPAHAVAHVMAGLTYGMPWKTFASITNRLNYSTRLINCDRDTVDCRYATEGNPFLYLSGINGQSSLFSHVQNLDARVMDDEFIDKVMKQLVLEVQNKSGSLLRLDESTTRVTTELDYYAFRYLVRRSASEYGLMWVGKSGVDNVAVKDGAKSESRRLDDFIVDCLHTNKVMTAYELAIHLSKKVNHIKLRLDLLQDSGSVMQLSLFKYCTRKYGESQISSVEEELKNRISHLLNKSLEAYKVLHLSIVETECNQILKEKKKTTFSLEFYRSLIDIWSGESEWQREKCFLVPKNNNELVFNSLSNAFDQLCRGEDVEKQEECIARVSQKIDASYRVLNRAFHNWRGSLRRGEL